MRNRKNNKMKSYFIHKGTPIFSRNSTNVTTPVVGFFTHYKALNNNRFDFITDDQILGLSDFNNNYIDSNLEVKSLELDESTGGWFLGPNTFESDLDKNDLFIRNKFNGVESIYLALTLLRDKGIVEDLSNLIINRDLQVSFDYVIKSYEYKRRLY